MTSDHACDNTQERLKSLVSEHGIVIARKSDATTASLKKAGFDVLDVEKQVILAIRPLQLTSPKDRKALILVSPFYTFPLEL